MQIDVLKTPSGALIPASEEAAEGLKKFKVGTPFFVEIRRARNYRFHRKTFALFKLGFDSWEPETPQTYKGEAVSKDLDRFRKDITILAGFYKAVYNARGEVRLEAESISFANMDEDQFEKVFKAVLNVIWDRVLKKAGYKSTEEVESTLERILRFE